MEPKDQMKYRYQNFIWFVPEGESEGRWVEIDYKGNSELLTSGHCTEFYYNGAERIKYNLDHTGKRDTIFYYNLDSVITHYSVGSEENIQNLFYQDGKFESFLWDGSIAISGIVEEHQLTEFKWEGKMASFYQLVSSKTYVWRGFEGFLREIAGVIQESSQSGAKYIPIHQIRSIDSLRSTLIDSAASTLERFSNLTVEPDCEDIKEVSTQFIVVTKLLLEEECKDLLERMQLELNAENFDALRKLTQIMFDKSVEADRNEEKIYIEWSRRFKPGDYLVAYLTHLDKKR